MATRLVIVESPAKGRTISRFLGSDFRVESSYGHIRDLPSSTLGVDVERNFEPHYVIPKKSRAVVKNLREAAEKAKEVILATDEDREGEAIAWHLTQALGLAETKAKGRKTKDVQRIVFHEITKRAIAEALTHPREIDMKRVDAQQARRILDRLVGYKLSPFLWKKVYRGLSAGRVQSVALRLIVEREREIQNFKPKEYWSIEATLSTKNGASFQATLAKIDGAALDKFAIASAAEAEQIVRELEALPASRQGAEWRVADVKTQALAKRPFPPFTTATLQQEAFRRLGFSAKQTMMLAQQLYEGVELSEGPTGLITYMRTDSFNLSEESLGEARAFLSHSLGSQYALAAPRRFKTKSKTAQEAHEAIRPTDPARTPESVKRSLVRNQWRLYDLIWRRFLATQMPEARFDATAVGISRGRFTFRATGQVLQFDGFLKIYPLTFQELSLPKLEKDEPLALDTLVPLQHFTEPPPRYTDASLVKILEKFGIGRPSTYAPIISTIQERRYIEKDEKRRFTPTEVGMIVNDILVAHFPEVVDVSFTAKMEEELDEIAEGKMEWRPLLREFYTPFAKRLEEKYETVKKHEVAETTDEVCEKCGRPMMVRLGRYGKFLACSGFPECKNAKPLKNELQSIGMRCPTCGEGEVVIRRTRRKKIFYGCSRYPECDYASWNDPRKEAESPRESPRKE